MASTLISHKDLIVRTLLSIKCMAIGCIAVLCIVFAVLNVSLHERPPIDMELS